jgi:hypothetical protein
MIILFYLISSSKLLQHSEQNLKDHTCNAINVLQKGQRHKPFATTPSTKNTAPEIRIISEKSGDKKGSRLLWSMKPMNTSTPPEASRLKVTVMKVFKGCMYWSLLFMQLFLKCGMENYAS